MVYGNKLVYTTRGTALLVIVLFIIVEHTLAATPCTTDLYAETGACYWSETEPADWQTAWMACHIKGGNLAVVNSSAVLDRLLADGILGSSSMSWIGASESVVPGVYRWVNGRVLTWTKWTTERRQNYKLVDRCMGLTPNGFNDISCTREYPAVCQTLPGDFYCDPLNDRDCAEWFGVRFLAPLLNAACKGRDVFNTETKLGNGRCLSMCKYATHFICRASKDGASCRGTYLPPSKPSGCVREVGTTYRGREYALPYEYATRYSIEAASYPYYATWLRARAACRAQGMKLLTIKSPQKQAMVTGINSWLDLTERNISGVWRWEDDGSVLVYNNWINNNPDFYKDGSCGYHVHNADAWVDERCEEERPFVCEFYTDDRCATVNCVNGGCRSDGDNYTCDCVQGYVGKHCDQEPTTWEATTTGVGEAQEQTDADCNCNWEVLSLGIFIGLVNFINVSFVIVIIMRMLSVGHEMDEEGDKLSQERHDSNIAFRQPNRHGSATSRESHASSVPGGWKTTDSYEKLKANGHRSRDSLDTLNL